MKNAILISVIAGSVLAACATKQATDPASRYYEIPAASSTVVVHHAIEIPAGSAHVILQGGAVVALQSLRRYEPFCEIEVNDVLETAQLVQPGTFVVTRVVRRQEMGSVARPIRLAGMTWGDFGIGIGIGSGGHFGIGVGTRIGGTRDDGATSALNAVHLRLKSAEQPNVRELRCAGGWADMSSAVYPTLAEMRNALGNLADIAIR